MKFISTKELRAHLPRVRKQLACGENFLLIHQSKPVATITPIQNDCYEHTDQDFEKSAIKDLGNEWLSEKEKEYYLSLDDYETR